MLNQALVSIEKQRGVVMMITLIVLVAMTLAGLALTRSVDTTNIIAGNLAFQQSAVQSTDTGVETAISWLEANAIGVTLRSDALADGYQAGAASALRDPAAGQTWGQFWTDALVPAGLVARQATDSAGNTVSYVVQRLCDNTTSGAAVTYSGCSLPPSNTITGDTKAGRLKLNFNNQGYYRITVRVDGPRNTVTYAQAIVGM